MKIYFEKKNTFSSFFFLFNPDFKTGYFSAYDNLILHKKAELLSDESYYKAHF
jgi:hypothetical protein